MTTAGTVAAAAAAASVPQPLFPRPSSPIKQPDLNLKPNPHPYAIKTTSTGVLSRSNSSPHNSQAAQYHYVFPTSPSPSGSPNRSPSNRNRPTTLHGHKYSKSLSSDSPSPLPIPPSFTFPSLAKEDVRFERHDSSSTFRRVKRADTLPSSAPILDGMSRMTSDDLPSNPKEWTPAQLASYLATALRVKSGDALSLPIPVARDIAQFVRESGITGRGFLRLNSADLESMGINGLWRTALLTASRSLRQNVLRGYIWGMGPVSDDDDPKQAPISAPPGSTRHRKIFHSRNHGGYRNGHVREMVESLERSGTISEGSTGHVRRRSGSVSSQGSGWSTDEMESPTRVQDEFFGGPKLHTESETEPTVEALLQTVPGPEKGPWGARAWEDDVGIWETVKRVAANADADRQHPEGEEVDSMTGSDAEFAIGITQSRNKKGDVGIGSGSWSVGVDGHGEGRMRGKKERRVVTAIFAGGTADEIVHSDEAVTSGEVNGGVSPPVQDVSQEGEARLRSQMDENWALLQVFKRRLEEVEGKVEDMEERERLLVRERQAAAARRDEEIQRESERMAQERGEARIREADAERRHREDNRLSLALVLRPQVLFSRILRLVSPPAHNPSLPTSVADTSTSKDGRPSKLLHPTTLSALPSYVFLVSLGVCVVVLRVVIRRILGRRRAWDL